MLTGTIIQMKVPFLRGKDYKGETTPLSSVSASSTMASCSFYYCTSTSYGGAISCSSVSTVSVLACTFSNCQASSYGGAIYSSSTASLNVEGSSFTFCKATLKPSYTSGGGAILYSGNKDSTTFYMSGCSIIGCITYYD